jgi:RNA polymerase sigma-70 factor (sigma-E family)
VRKRASAAVPRASRLEDLYLAHVDAAMRFAYLLLGEREAAQDLVQDAFVRVFGRYADLKDPNAFGPYLRRTLINLATDRRRKTALEFQRRSLLGSTAVGELPDIVERTVMRSALSSLPTRQRAALVLRYYEDLSETQAADALGCSVTALKSLVTRGLARLRERLEGEGR